MLFSDPRFYQLARRLAVPRLLSSVLLNLGCGTTVLQACSGCIVSPLSARGGRGIPASRARLRMQLMPRECGDRHDEKKMAEG